jgi:hypothetical protein
MPPAFTLCEHRIEGWPVDLERDMQVEVVLVLELERHVRGLEEREARAIVHAIEGVQRLGLAPALGFADLERVDERQAQKTFVEAARLLGVATAVSAVM